MREVIQMYKSVYAIEKSDYNSENRSLLNQWPTAFQSTIGYVENKTLFLPDSERSNPDIRDSSLIVLQDIQGFNPFLLDIELRNLNLPDWFKRTISNNNLFKNQQIICFPSVVSKYDFEIFRFVKIDRKTFEFSLNYMVNQSSIGLPKREDHVIAILNDEKSFSYRINGKIDGHAQRIFMEYKSHLSKTFEKLRIKKWS